MLDLYLEHVQGVKWHASWEAWFIFKAIAEVWGWSSTLNVYMESEINMILTYLR